MIEQDVMSQEIAARSLAIAIREAIIASTRNGLQNNYVIRTLEGALQTETDIKDTSELFARMYA